MKFTLKMVNMNKQETLKAQKSLSCPPGKPHTVEALKNGRIQREMGNFSLGNWYWKLTPRCSDLKKLRLFKSSPDRLSEVKLAEAEDYYMWHFSTTQFRQKRVLKTILTVPPVALSYLRPPFRPYKELMKRSQSALSPGERPNRMWGLAVFHLVSDEKTWSRKSYYSGKKPLFSPLNISGWFSKEKKN